jgi:ABC-type uncharacterized transport system ATPase subunit
VLILKKGRKIIDGTLEEIKRCHTEAGDASLEAVFFRATEETQTSP